MREIGTRSEELEDIKLERNRVGLPVGASGNITFSEHEEDEKFDQI